MYIIKKLAPRPMAKQEKVRAELDATLAELQSPRAMELRTQKKKNLS